MSKIPAGSLDCSTKRYGALTFLAPEFFTIVHVLGRNPPPLRYFRTREPYFSPLLSPGAGNTLLPTILDQTDCVEWLQRRASAPMTKDKSGTKAQRRPSKDKSPQGDSPDTQEDTEDNSEGKERKAGLDVTRLFLAITVAIIVGSIGHAVWKNSGPESSTRLKLVSLEAENASLPEPLTNKALPLGELHQQLRGANLERPRAYVGLYSSGRWLGEGWGTAPGLKESIANAYEAALAASPTGAPTDALLVIPTGRKRLKTQNYRGLLSNVHRGMRGIIFLPNDDESLPESDSGKLEYALSPIRTIATNRSLVDELKKEAKDRDLSLKRWIKDSEAFSFDARQFFIPLAKGEKAQETLRGNRAIPVSEVTLEKTEEFTRLLGEWMFNNLHPDGRMTYMYYPSTGREARNANNMIRQWMGTVAMGRVSRIHPELGVDSRAEDNIRFNLKRFFRKEGDIGFIEYRDTAKLGAASLAMISLIESPARAAFHEEEDALMKLTLRQWQENGELRTFYKPDGRNDNHNFYPGETLLAWSLLYERAPEPELLKKAMASYRYYKEWHLENRNPAFIPWHTQAYYNIWKLTKSNELKDWIFAMNDWLVDTMQSNSRVAYDDTIGRFYAPTERFGRPHASSTGVYIEGLIDAFALARAIGDKKREEKYRRSIILGLRSSMQLQFVDNVDMFFVTNRNRLRGGIRTTVYDNAVRVDNVQHVLMGVQKVLREFKAEDYHP